MEEIGRSFFFISRRSVMLPSCHRVGDTRCYSYDLPWKSHAVEDRYVDTIPPFFPVLQAETILAAGRRDLAHSVGRDIWKP